MRRVAAELSDVRLGGTVDHVERTPWGVAVRATGPDGTHETITADGCVITSVFDDARRIWPKLGTLAPEFAAEERVIQLISISLGHTRCPDQDAYIVAVPTGELPDTLLMFMLHNKAPDRAPVGHGLIALYTDTAVTARYLERSSRRARGLGRRHDRAALPRAPRPPRHAARRALAHRRLPRRSGLLACDQGAAGGHFSRIAGDVFGAGSMEAAGRRGERAPPTVWSRCPDLATPPRIRCA